MSAPAAIKGCFSDFKLIKTRKLAQLIIEIPIEQADAALAALGGLPRSDNERWIAIALLDMRKFDAEGNLPDESRPGAIHARESGKGERQCMPRRPFHELPMPTQVALKSNDPKFQFWMSTMPIGKECASTAEAIRQWCDVTTRADIQPGTKPGERWIMLLNEYEGIR